MSFGENLQFYRKNKDITQEQLAEELGVSRQTISKWEAGTSYPEMEKILQLCDMFGCSMDLLLRGSAEENVTEDAAGYDRNMNKFCASIMTGVGLILFGVSLQVFLSAIPFDENLASAIFMLFVIPAVLIFVVAGLQKERFSKKYPVIQPFYPEEVLDKFEQRFPILIAAGIGTILVGLVFEIVSENFPIPSGYTDDLYTSIFMLFVAAGVVTLVYAGMQKSKYDIEAYNKENLPHDEKKESDKRIGTWCGCIMLAATAIFLIAGLGYNLWQRAWIVYPVAGILCGIASIIIRATTKEE
ncbi:MAG: helix-turn-helix transcriptional regulator [Muricomes sp.]